ncbi:MAG: hypothetical protein RIA69_04615 [Cyclobacteriaceae bacterium]
MLKSIFGLLAKFWILITIVLAVLIAITSLIPLPELPPVPGKDKTLHLLAYISLAFPCALARPKFWWFFLPILFILFGGIIELIQPYVNRYRELLDMLANTCGVMIGSLLGYLFRKTLL